MLGKLFKHEWKAVSKFGCIIVLAQLAITLLGNIYYRSSVWVNLFDESGELRTMASVTWLLVGVVGLILMILVLCAGIYAVYIYMGIRFYRTMYSEEGYLTHTLPVTVHKLLLSKIAVSGIWSLIITVVMAFTMASLVFAMLTSILKGQQSDRSIWEILGEALTMIGTIYAEEMGIDFTAVGIAALITIFVSPFLSMATLFGALTIGQLSKKHKGLMGILVYFGIMLGEILVGMIVGVASMSMSIGKMLEGETVGMGGTMLVSYIITYSVSIVLYIVSHYIIKNKLNLE